MRFADIVGHEEAKERLVRMADSGRVPHALMLAGKPGVGKMRLARAFAQYLACEHPVGGDSCGVCPNCRQVEKLNFPDVAYVYPVVRLKGSSKAPVSTDYAAQWRDYLRDNSYMPQPEWLEAIDAGNSQPIIYVDESAAIIHRLSLSSYNSRYKITIIWQPEKMNVEAANKLLKIIEEPYEDTVFILVSNNPEALLPTIRSRVQTIYLNPLEAATIASALERDYGLSAEAAHTAARLAQGSFLNALTAVSSSEEPAEFRDLFQAVMRSTYARNTIDMKLLSEKIAAFGREKIRRFFDYVGSMLRENYIYNLRTPELNFLSQEEETFSCRFSRFVNDRNVEALTEAVGKAANDIARNSNAKIVCFDLLLQIMMLIRQ